MGTGVVVQRNRVACPRYLRRKGDDLNKLAVTAVAGTMLLALPASVAGIPVSDDFLTIGGPKRLEARSKLRVPISCSVECDTTAYTKLRLPDGKVTDKATGHLGENSPRNLVVKLNDAATESIKEHPNAARLRVNVIAEDSGSGERAHVLRVFRFKSS